MSCSLNTQSGLLCIKGCTEKTSQKAVIEPQAWTNSSPLSHHVKRKQVKDLIGGRKAVFSDCWTVQLKQSYRT